MSEPKLTPQQQAVVDNRGGTLLVSAAAGSGKTKVLVDRVMSRIVHEGRNINEFLIITFTNAAAAELKAKISAAIAKELGKTPNNRHIQRQMNLISLSQISTVHAFCGNLIRQYGYLMEIPADYVMLEDAQREEMLSRCLEDVLETFYEEMTPGFRQLADTLGAGRNDNGLVELVQNVFEKLLSQPYPEQWLAAQQLTISEDQELTDTLWGRILINEGKRQLRWLISRYEWAISCMTGDEKLIPKYLPAYETQKKRIEAMLEAMDGSWEGIGPALSMEYPRVSVRNYPDPEFLELIKNVKNDGKKMLEKLQKQFSRSEKQLIQEQNQLAPALEALLAVVGRLYQRFSQEKRRKNYLDFSDQEHLAIALLVDAKGNPTAVAQEVSAQFVEIMVDEYQDSNRIQEMIYRAIAGRGDKNRFLVGDVKQSIYSFRQAEPELFLEKYKNYQPAEEAKEGAPRYLVLSKNFRSRPEILNAANHIFETVMDQELGGLSYDENEMLYPGLDEYPQDHASHVAFHVLSFPKNPKGRDDDSTKYQKEAQWVANRIVHLLKEQIPVRENGGTRPVRPEDIAILFRSRDPMGHYARALSRVGVPVASDNGEDVFQSPEVQVLMNFLRVLDNPHQDVPLLAVLCSPLFQFSNEQLAKIRLDSKKRKLYDALCASEMPSAKKAVERLTELRRLGKQLSGESLIWYLLNDCGLLRIYSAMEAGTERRENLLMIYELARTASGGEHIYLYELVRYLERQAENGVVRSGSGSKGVTLTTIHKSKGLEYPVVFLCDISRKFNFRELMDNVLVDGDDGLGAKITDPIRRIRYPGIAYDALRVKKRSKLLSEELRVLYVAVTRPKDYLFMTYATADGDRFLTKLLPGAGNPAERWAVNGAGCLGDWLLLSALNQIEAGQLFAVAGRPQCTCKSLQYPWEITYEQLEQMEWERITSEQTEMKSSTQFIPDVHRLKEALTWEYAHKIASQTPSKLTATQLKGRDKDDEAAEETPQARKIPQLQRPEFILKQSGLTGAEKGTAAHLFLQYADFSRLSDLEGIQAELERLEFGEYLTPEQAEAVSTDRILRLFQSPLGVRLLTAPRLMREFKFSLLTDAANYYQSLQEEQVLLQGVVDAAILEDDGIVVVDFKTDHVDSNGAKWRAQHYRGQLETYRKALERIFKKPVKEMILYFLETGEAVRL